MLPKQHRLPSHLIPEILKKGKRFSFPCFVLIISHQSPVTNHQSPKFSFIVSKKVDKRSTVRNHLKRQYRAIIRQLLNRMTLSKDIVFLISKQSATKTAEQLKFECEKALLQLGPINKADKLP